MSENTATLRCCDLSFRDTVRLLVPDRSGLTSRINAPRQTTNMIKTAGQIAISLGLLAGSVIWGAHTLNFVPDGTEATLQGRIQFCDNMATSLASNLKGETPKALSATLSRLVEINANVVSIGVRNQGRLIAQSKLHPTLWNESARTNHSSTNEFSVALSSFQGEGGHLEIQFTPLHMTGLWGNARRPMLLTLFCGASFALLSWLVLSRSLIHLDPSKAVPSQVRLAFDSLIEGLLMIDAEGRIVLVNRAFGEIVGKDPEELLGQSPDHFSWLLEHESEQSTPNSEEPNYPWNECLNGFWSTTWPNDLFTVAQWPKTKICSQCVSNQE